MKLSMRIATCMALAVTIAPTANSQWLETDSISEGNFDSFDVYELTYHDFTSSVDEIISNGRIIRRGQDTLSFREFLQNSQILANQQLMAAVNGAIAPATPACDELAGLTDFFRDVVENLTSRLQANEWGTMIISNTGNLTFYRGQIYTDGDANSVSHRYNPADVGNITSVIHTHPPQGNAIDLQNRYPSQVDWNAAGVLVSAGANGNTLTLGIVDPMGDVRLFNYSDRSLYEALSNSQLERGINLPGSIADDADTHSCVTIE